MTQQRILVCVAALLVPLFQGVGTSHALAADLIWTDNKTDQVHRGAIDGSGSVTELFGIADLPGLPGSSAPEGVAFNANFIYWADSLTDQILRGAIDGSGSAIELFGLADYPGSPPSGVAPTGVAIDDSFVYWTDPLTDQILRGAIDGSGTVIELFGLTDFPGLPTTGAAPHFIATVIPEPSTLTLTGLGLLGLLAYGWRNLTSRLALCYVSRQ